MKNLKRLRASTYHFSQQALKRICGLILLPITIPTANLLILFASNVHALTIEYIEDKISKIEKIEFNNEFYDISFEMSPLFYTQNVGYVTTQGSIDPELQLHVSSNEELSNFRNIILNILNKPIVAGWEENIYYIRHDNILSADFYLNFYYDNHYSSENSRIDYYFNYGPGSLYIARNELDSYPCEIFDPTSDFYMAMQIPLGLISKCAPIPEPNTSLLLGIGLVGAVVSIIKKRINK